jgi:hypothetical protein
MQTGNNKGEESMTQYAKLVDGVLTYPPETIRKPGGTTIIGYNHNEKALLADGWLPVVSDSQPSDNCAPVYSIEEDKIRITWTILPEPEPVPVVPTLIEGGIEVPVIVIQSQTLGKGIGIVATDEGDLLTYIDHESPRPAGEVIQSRIAAAVEAKRKARADAKAAAKKGNLQGRIAAIEAFLGIA